MRFVGPPVPQAGEAALELHVDRTNEHDPEGAGEHAMTDHAAAGSGLKQETTAIVAVGLTMLGTMLYTTSRLEARIVRVEVRIDRVQAEMRADREVFTREILRLTSKQSRLAGIVEGAHADAAR